jgi:hypothetical protein
MTHKCQCCVNSPKALFSIFQMTQIPNPAPRSRPTLRPPPRSIHGHMLPLPAYPVALDPAFLHPSRALALDCRCSPLTPDRHVAIFSSTSKVGCPRVKAMTSWWTSRQLQDGHHRPAQFLEHLLSIGIGPPRPDRRSGARSSRIRRKSRNAAAHSSYWLKVLTLSLGPLNARPACVILGFLVFAPLPIFTGDLSGQAIFATAMVAAKLFVGVQAHHQERSPCPLPTNPRARLPHSPWCR